MNILAMARNACAAFEWWFMSIDNTQAGSVRFGSRAEGYQSRGTRRQTQPFGW
jgi:hypothetical protein